MKLNQNYADFPAYYRDAEEHAIRNRFILKLGQAYIAELNDIKKFKVLNCGTDLISKTEDFLKQGKLESPFIREHNEPFGVVNTVANAGCLAFATYNAFKLVLDDAFSISFDDVVNLIVSNGYRMWKFSNASKVLSYPSVVLEDVKKSFKNREDVQQANTLKELYSILGEPVGLGSSHFFLDEFISYTAGCSPRVETRINSFLRLPERLQKGIPVIVRVNTSVYYMDDQEYFNEEKNKQSSGHFVVLIGFRNGKAVLLDNAVPGSIYELPIEKFVKSTYVDGAGHVAIYDLWHLVNN